ncbi:uncharacterized protein LOC108094282 [Drosophila ficusphila]|uniref:uncharacterized protein LOC108094282 n=1 Tax=Drosophila ficusphila TaxID=30025 RepID=UPI0007E6FFDA|nr:uncharacterized protein LOC108094282 [Drosophila ficusphila]
MKTVAKILVFQLFLVIMAGAIEYQLFVDEDDVFAPCENQPGNPSNSDSLFDPTWKITTHGGKVAIEAQQTVVWKDVQPGDTVKLFAQVFRMEKNTWQKTMISVNSNNFCKNMFDKGQYWYQFWTQYIRNSDEIKTKCIVTPGAVIKYNPIDVELKVNLNVPNMSGRYKVVVQFDAFDKSNVKRPVSICSEFRGNITKV